MYGSNEATTNAIEMGLSNTWETATDIYNVVTPIRDMSARVYRDSNGFEAMVIGEDNDTYHIEGNGVRCRVNKSTTKRKIHKVSSDYVLRKPVRR